MPVGESYFDVNLKETVRFVFSEIKTLTFTYLASFHNFRRQQRESGGGDSDGCEGWLKTVSLR